VGERLRRFWRRCAPFALGMVVLVCIIGSVGLTHLVVGLYGANAELRTENAELRATIDRAAVERGALDYKLGSCMGAVKTMQTQLQMSIPVGKAFWCVGMPLEIVDEAKRPLVVAGASYVKALPPDEPGAKICVIVVGIFASDVAGKIYVPVQRALPGGAIEGFVVHFEVDEEAGKLVPVGHINVATGEWVPAP